MITTLSESGKRTGITVSSFNTLSLKPPMVLWSIDKQARSYDTFIATDSFAIHVLAADQEELSNRFARAGSDKFAGLDCRPGLSGNPILPKYAACFECETAHRYDGGDHTILVGRVLDFDIHEHEPLLFHRGGYTEIS